MPRRVFIRDGGLTSSRPIPSGYVAIGTDSGIPKKQILSIISEFTGAVTGNGTTNYVPKWNSVTGLSSTSPIYIDGSDNVGVGTTSPTSRIHIKGTGTSSSTDSLKVDDGDNNPLLQVRDDGYFDAGNGNLIAYDNGSNIFIGANSNKYRGLNIGPYNTPFVYFDIQNSRTTIYNESIIGGTAVGLVGNTARVKISGDGSIGLRNIGFQYNGSNGFTDYAIGNESDGLNTTIRLSFNPTQFGYGGVATGLDANNSWRVGIGTSSVSSHRVVISDGLKLQSTTFSSSAFDIQNSGSSLFIVNNDGYISNSSTSDASTFFIKNKFYGSQTLKVQSDLDGRGLVVTENADVNNSNGLEMVVNNTARVIRGLSNISAATISKLSIQTTSLSVGSDIFSSSAMVEIKGSGTTSATNAMKIDNSNSSPLLYVRDDGYVRIGTSTGVRAEFDINANGGNGLYKFLGGNGNWGIHINPYDSTLSTPIISSVNNGIYIGSKLWIEQEPQIITRNADFNWDIYGSADWNIRQYLTTNKLFTVKNDGNVGIGTASPATKLDVVGDINTSTLYRVGATAGWTGTFSADGQIVSVIGGIITSVM